VLTAAAAQSFQQQQQATFSISVASSIVRGALEFSSLARAFNTRKIFFEALWTICFLRHLVIRNANVEG